MRARGPKKVSLAILIIAVWTILSACSGNNNANTNAEGSASQPTSGGKKTVNIAITYAPGGINPLAPVGLVSTYVAGLMFPPLMEIDSDMTYKPMLADSIETTDNVTFTVKLNANAKWTDGTPVTADDVVFTLKLISNPAIASNLAYLFAGLEGLDNVGFLAEGQSEISGVVKVDDHTLTMKTKVPTTLNIFKDTIGRNLMTLPQAALKDIAPEDLDNSDFMQKPTVTSGPYKLVDIDRDHYATMEANKDYYRGAPKIERLNFKVMQGTAIAAQLQSGEIDMNIPSAGIIPIEDYKKVQGLGNVTTMAVTPLATPYMYINEKVVPDAKQRQAISYAMNRELIVEKLLKGAGEVVDGYFNSTSPYLNENIKPVGYDPEKAKSLLQQSGWDSGKQLTLSVLSGDATLEQAARIIAEDLNAIGVKVNIQMLDLGTLLDKLLRMEYDLGVLTVSLAPINPLPDIAYFLNEGNPNGYKNAEAEKLIASIGAEVDEAKIKESYGKLQEIIARDVPMPSIYATKALGAVNNRVTGATPKDFGMFINVYEWDIK
jgi:ABC-type dipeptide transport system, periplasmic component